MNCICSKLNEFSEFAHFENDLIANTIKKPENKDVTNYKDHSDGRFLPESTVCALMQRKLSA
jgi:hypothetical protein